MRFLADESCDFAVVRSLRGAGHDVLAVAEMCPAADDVDIIRLARSAKRVLLTEDKHFGQLVYAQGHSAIGVVFIRFPATVRTQLPEAILRLVHRLGTRLRGAYMVVQPGRVRIIRMPSS